LLYRGVRGDRRGWRWTWGVTALCCARDIPSWMKSPGFVASRTASAYDSLLDSIGAFAASRAVGVFRCRRSAREEEIGASRTLRPDTPFSGEQFTKELR